MVDKNVEVITISTDNKFYYPNLVESCRKNKGKLTTLGMGEEWRGYNWKFRKMIDYLSNLSDDTIVCFIDGYDVISCRDLTELGDEFIKLKNKYKCKIIAGCDDYGFIGKKVFDGIFFRKCGNHYLNSGTYIGYAKDLKDIINKIHQLNPSDSADDQVLMIQYYNEHPGEIHIDHECKLFLTLMYPLMNIDVNIDNNNKVYTDDYKSMPFFIHAQGNGFLNNIIVKLGYGTPDSDIKKNLIYSFISKSHYHLKRVFMEHKYIFLSMIVILSIIVVFMTKNIIKNPVSNKNKKNKYRQIV